jgi:DNA-binding LacI/PurR family transcriptional regulator
MLCDRSPDPAIPAIRIDDTAGAAEATRHLLRLGHRRIAYFSTPFDPQAAGDPAVAADRYRGYLSALQGAGIAGDPAWVVQGEAALSGGYAMMRELLSRPGPRPTAVFCTCDVMAIGALRALYEAGVHVPSQMAIVGFDGVTLGQYTTPALTTINQPREQIGRLAADLIFTLLDSQEPAPRDTVLEATLLVRESCGAAAQR